MALAQLRLLPAYLRLPFRSSTWTFTFCWAAAASTALVRLEVLRPAGYRSWQLVLLTAISLLVGGISARTVLALSRRELLPRIDPPTVTRTAGTTTPVRQPAG